jgi:3-hydroxy-9,10-secoandrosta-1,3,5(10)-triene-9,17-dione monooxygenase
VAQARLLVPLLRAAAPEIERSGQLTAEVEGALHRAGFFALHAPRSHGGPEAGLRTAVEVHRTLARGDGSAAWVCMLLSGAGMVASRLGDRARTDVWGADPGSGVCANVDPHGAAVRVPGGVSVSGRWPTLSGVHSAPWALLCTQVVTDTGRVVDTVLVLVPVDPTAIERTWDVTGMEGTGSDSLVLTDVLVPDHRVLSLTEAEPAVARPDEPLQRVQPTSFMVPAHAAVLLGMAEAALEHTRDRLAAGRSAAGSPVVRAQVAQAASAIDSAALHLARAVDDVEDALAAGRLLDVPARARIRMDAGTIATDLRRALDLLLDVGGAGSFARRSPVQRIWRDVTVASRHPLLSPGLSTGIEGRALLGLPETAVDDI